MKTADIHEPGSAAAETAVDTVARLLAPPMHTLGRRGTVLTPLVLVFVLSVVSTAVLQSFVVKAGSQGAGLGALLWSFAVLSPVLALMKGLFLGLAAWALLVLLGAGTRAVPILSALLYGEAILALQNVWIAAVVLVRGRFDPTLPVPVGLDAIVGPAHPLLLGLARGVTPFHAAWLLFLTFALTSPHGLPRWKGAVTALALWSVSAGLVISRVLLS